MSSFSRIDAIESTIIQRNSDEVNVQTMRKTKKTVSSKKEREELLSTLKGTVAECIKSQMVIADNLIIGEQLLSALHQIYSHHILPSRTPFEFFCLLESWMNTNAQVIEMFKILHNIQSIAGDKAAEKAFYKISLSQQMLKEYTEILLFHRDTKSMFYAATSLLCSEKYTQPFLLTLLNLEGLQFQFLHFEDGVFVELVKNTQKKSKGKKRVKVHQISVAQQSSTEPFSKSFEKMPFSFEEQEELREPKVGIKITFENEKMNDSEDDKLSDDHSMVFKGSPCPAIVHIPSSEEHCITPIKPIQRPNFVSDSKAEDISDMIDRSGCALSLHGKSFVTESLVEKFLDDKHRT